MGFALLWKTKGYITDINEFLIQKGLQQPQNYFSAHGSLFSLPENGFSIKKKFFLNNTQNIEFSN